MSGRDVLCWVGHVWNQRVRDTIWEFGDRITDLSVFCQFVNADGSLTQTFDPDLLLPYREKWPHIRFWLAYRNDGIASIFTALRNSAPARARLVNDLGEALDRYPWMHGIDTDLEQGGGSQNSTAAEQIFRQVTDLCRARGIAHSAALPPLTSTGSVGGENWVRYQQLGQLLDHVAIMSYDFAWRGSAPGPTSPGFWMRNVYNWATSQIDPSKISWGLPLYSYFWNIGVPPQNDLGWRGQSGSYYSAYGYFSGYLARDGGFANPPGSGNYERIGWLVYRDPDSRACWALLECYDYVDPDGYTTQQGMQFASFDGRDYAVRYGQPGGNPIWSIVDNGPGSAHANYPMLPRRAVNRDGELVEPTTGKYNLTVELLQRYPTAATIIDDYATSQQQLGQVYVTRSGSWSFWQQSGGGYKQYRGSGRLDFNNAFPSQSLYVQARFQFAQGGTFRLHNKGITAEVTNAGLIRVLKGSTVLGQASVGSIPVGAAAGNDAARRVIGLRVRENSARVYFSASETNIPRVLEVSTTPDTGVEGGRVGIGSTQLVWVDHTFLGDGWYYQPREAVEVTLGAETRVMGRIPREGITWSGNMFRPVEDIDEIETREQGISLDWEYAHWLDSPLESDTAVNLRIVPLDHDVWLGRSFAFNSRGGEISYWTDAETITYWRAVAGLDYGVAGIALWTVGQEDLRIWDALGSGELAHDTRVLQG